MNRRFYIVGAHSRARTLAEYLCYLYPAVAVEAYLVDNDEKNPDLVGGVPVIRLDGENKLHTDYPVFLGTRGVYHARLLDKLKALSFHEIYPVTTELDSKIRKSYLKKYFAQKGRKFCLLDEMEMQEKVGKQFDARSSQGLFMAGSQKELITAENPKGLSVDARIYVAKSIYDKELKAPYVLTSDEVPIQVGAALTDKRLGRDILTDDMGENISSKNRQFCELTALYWIWKHAPEDMVGLAHYRRHFLLPKDWLARVQCHQIDVILPIPLYVAPSLAENFKERHDPADWEHMMEYLRESDEKEWREAEDFFRTNLYSPCNMFIMRREVLHQLCAWMFQILFAVADKGGQKEDVYLNRYPGFLSERLITFFFEKYQERYNVVYADKNFLP